jgi:hypothetical protein
LYALILLRNYFVPTVLELTEQEMVRGAHHAFITIGTAVLVIVFLIYFFLAVWHFAWDQAFNRIRDYIEGWGRYGKRETYYFAFYTAWLATVPWFVWDMLVNQVHIRERLGLGLGWCITAAIFLAVPAVMSAITLMMIQKIRNRRG